MEKKKKTSAREEYAQVFRSRLVGENRGLDALDLSPTNHEQNQHKKKHRKKKKHKKKKKKIKKKRHTGGNATFKGETQEF